MAKRNAFYLKQLHPLIAAEVVQLVSDAAGEFYGLRFKLAPRAGEPANPPKYKTLWFSSDDEGNDIGSFHIEEG